MRNNILKHVMISRDLSRDVFASLFVAIFINLYPLFLSVKYGTPIYIDHDEVVWMKTVMFCGREFSFYEQKWGLIVPVLCLIYPLRLIMEPYYIPTIRPIIVFLNCFLLLRILRRLFGDERTVLLIALLHYSYFIGVFGSPFHLFSLIRIFSPSFFAIFFLLFYLSFLNFLTSKRSRDKFIAGVTLGVTFYSSSHWYMYAVTCVVLEVIYFAFLKKKREMKDLLHILLIGVTLGIPALIFNYLQFQILGDSVKRGGYFITGLHKIVISKPQEMYVSLVFFGVSTISFLLAGNFSPKSVFCFLSAVSGVVLVAAEVISGVFVLMLHHVIHPFNMFCRINLGFIFERISRFSGMLGRVLLLIFFLFFITRWLTFFKTFFGDGGDGQGLTPDWAGELIRVDVAEQKRLENVSAWIKENTSRDSVIIFEGKRLYIRYAEMFYELRLSLMSGRYAFHSIINFFSDMSDQEVFERFILREKLIGRTVEDLMDPNNIPAGFSTWGGHWEIQRYTGRAFFGLPQGFSMEKYHSGSSAVQDLMKRVSELFSDEEYMFKLMDKYKIDYVIRFRPKREHEFYLEPVTRIEGWHVFRFSKHHTGLKRHRLS